MAWFRPGPELRVPARVAVTCVMGGAALLGSAWGADSGASRLEETLLAYTRPEALVGFRPRTAAGARGLRHVLEGRALPYALPLWVHRLVPGPASVEELWRSEGQLPSPFQRDDDRVVALGDALSPGEGSTRLLARGCLTCHAGPVGTRLVAGLPNAHLDLVPATAAAETLRRLDVVRTLESRHATEVLGDTLGGWVPERVRDFYRQVRDYRSYTYEVLLPAYRHARVRGDNTGAYGAWIMGAKIADPEGTGFLMRRPGDPRTRELEELVTTTALPPVDPMPWWTIRFKRTAYRFRDSPHHSPLDFNFNFYIPERHVDDPGSLDAHVAKVEARRDLVADVLQFARETVPPALPPGPRRELLAAPARIAEGSRLFHGGPNSTGEPMGCAGCHGTYRAEGDTLVVDYPDVRLREVGTDPAYNAVLRSFAPVARRIARTRAFYGPDLAPATREVVDEGYQPPVLVGVWASAPYLHNGSVPTLADMLTPPEERPRIWGRRLDDPSAYDHERVGLPHEEIDAGRLAYLEAAAANQPVRSRAATEHRRFYDTRAHGRSNAGHPFGTRLTAEEKASILAFLKSLSPHEARPRMRPASR